MQQKKAVSLITGIGNFTLEKDANEGLLYPLVKEFSYWQVFIIKLLPVLSLCGLSVMGYSQVKSFGTPRIENYTKSEYNAGTQNWGIAQDNNGFIYFANNDGILRFDGLHWDLIETSLTSPVRSVFSGSNNLIFAGLFNDFGVLKQDGTGPLFYESLRHLLPDSDIEFDEIWRIHEISQGVIFQSFDHLFLLNNNKIEVIKPKNRFHFSFQVNGRLFLHEPGLGLFEYINGIISEVPWAYELIDADILSIIEIRNNHLLIGTGNKGIYKFENGKLDEWRTPANELVGKNKLFSAARTIEDQFIFGTILDGVVISDFEGRIVQHINRVKGLQNNTVLSIFQDRDQNLWLGLDNGIDYLEINSPLSYISDKEGLGTGYCCIVFEGDLFLGTNQGLYVRSFYDDSNRNGFFELVENTAGQVWSLEVFDEQLVCGHNSGTFIIRNNVAVKISEEEGAWRYIRLNDHPEMLLGGHYNGLVLLRKGSDGWEFHKKIKGFNESSRFINQDNNGTLWISHGGKGVFRVHLNETADSVSHYQLFTRANGLPSNDRNILFTYNDEAFISAVDGIYEYRESSGSFEKSSELNQLFSLDGQLLALNRDDSGNSWFIARNESGLIRQNEDMNFTKITTPFKKLDGKYVNGFEFIYPLSNDHVFFGIDNGFAHYSSKISKSYYEKYPTFITKVEMPYLDSVIHLNPDIVITNVKVPFSKNVFRFHYSAPFYVDLDELQFSFFMDNYSEEWSGWSFDKYRDFTNLPEGDYILRVKAKNIFNVESEISTFYFTILPPWHRSRIAYFLYFILVSVLISFIVKFVLFRIELSKSKEKLKHETQLQKREEQFQHQSLMAEKEIIRLRNEKLQNEMLHRDKELANQTMGIIQKNKFLVNLKDELRDALKSTTDPRLKTKLSSLARRINKEIDNKQQNHIFETYFDEVHEVFFIHLKKQFPDISPREMRLCAYIRMNLTSKEIAALLNITIRGVEISRYRLRKKLKVSRDTNLSTFLSNL